MSFIDNNIIPILSGENLNMIVLDYKEEQYVNTLRAMIKENSEDEKFTNDMKNLFNDVKDVKQYNPDDEDFEGNTTFNIYNTFLSVTGSIDSLTQNKQNLLSSTNLLNVSYIGTGIINNTVFNYLSGLTSNYHYKKFHYIKSNFHLH